MSNLVETFDGNANLLKGTGAFGIQFLKYMDGAIQLAGALPYALTSIVAGLTIALSSKRLDISESVGGLLELPAKNRWLSRGAGLVTLATIYAYPALNEVLNFQSEGRAVLAATGLLVPVTLGLINRRPPKNAPQDGERIAMS